MNRHIDREEDLFAAALAQPTGNRAAFLDGACNGDHALRGRLHALLVAHDRPESLLTSLPAELSARTLAQAEEQPGDAIGPYRLREKLGEGGCGVVWRAEQTEPVRREVALKVIKLGMDTKTVVARFEAERQALALMDHPNIAKVFDAGATGKGRPFFVMELVRGVPITRFCDENKVPFRERLALFVQVCHAIQHAHQKGIIHRDIKPSNVLVSRHDDTAVPEVIDFGIAKATQGRLTDQTVFTAFEQFIGTPAYMAPEQADFNALDVDTRSDIYSLGVLLYELLVGRLPFDPQTLRKGSLEQIRKVICEKDPPRPSTLARALAPAERTTVAGQRGIPPVHFPGLLHGDLDGIVMKALEKNRTRRYQTANALAMDVQRYLANEPVLARPPTAAYRLSKQISRHRVGFVAGSVVLVALTAGLLLTTLSWRRERNARERAESAETATREAEALAAAARANAERLLLFVVADLGEQLDNLGQQPLLRKVAGEVLAYYEHLDSRLDTRETRAGHALAMAGLSTAGWMTVSRSSEFLLGERRGRERLEQALGEMRSLEATGPLTPFMRSAYAGVLWAMAGQCYREGRPGAGVPLLEQAETLLHSLRGDAQLGTWSDRFLTRLILGKGTALEASGRDSPWGNRPNGLAEFKRALDRAAQQCRETPDDHTMQLTAIDSRIRLSRALATFEPTRRNEAIGIVDIARRDAAAIVSERPFLVRAHSLLATAIRNHGLLVRLDWRFAEAGQAFDRSVEVLRAIAKGDLEAGSGYTPLPDALATRAELRWTMGNFAGAEEDLREAIQAWTHPVAPPSTRPLVLRGYENLARMLAATGRSREADEQLALADAAFARLLDERPWLEAAARAELLFQRDLRRADVEQQRLNWPAVLAIAERHQAQFEHQRDGNDASESAAKRSARTQFLTAALEQGDLPLVRRQLEHVGDAAGTRSASRSLQAHFTWLGRQLARLEAQARTGETEAARQELAATWSEVEALLAAGPDYLFNQIQTARALLLRAELGGTHAEKHAWLDQAASWLRPAAASGRLTRLDGDLLLARVEARLAAIGAK